MRPAADPGFARVRHLSLALELLTRSQWPEGPTSALLLPGADLVRGAGGAADHDQRRRRRGRLELPLRAGLAVHARPGRDANLLAVQRRLHLARMDEVKLLLSRLRLVVLGDQHVASVLRDRVDPEGGDAEMMANRLPGSRPVLLDGRDLVDVGELPTPCAR